jgi:hypothetical protein
VSGRKYAMFLFGVDRVILADFYTIVPVFMEYFRGDQQLDYFRK